MFFTPKKPCRRGHTKRYVANGHCVQCEAMNKANFKKANPVKTIEQKTKHHLKFNYGISIEEYNELIQKQNNLCAICEQPETAKFKNKIKKLAVDHCKETKKIRGLLCLNCNQGIGKLKHNPNFLRKAALYCEQSQ